MRPFVECLARRKRIPHFHLQAPAPSYVVIGRRSQALAFSSYAHCCSASVAIQKSSSTDQKASSPASNDPITTSQSAKAEVSMQRFWKKVDIHQLEDGQYSIRLDTRSLKTPAGNKLTVPHSKLALAILVAREWDEQRKILKQHSLPLTSLVSRAIDGMAGESHGPIIDGLMDYLDTDTICFHESKPLVLANMQAKHWDPLVTWVQKTYQVKLNVHRDSILFSKQPDATKTTLRAIVASFDSLKLAAFERAVHVTKSFVIALALIEGRLTVDEASEASRVEVLSQISRWGEVEDTHDVDHQEIRMKLGSVACALINTS